MKPLIIIENVRSAYNVGNIIRTADALGFDVLLSGFSAHPDEKLQVKKSSLGAEEYVGLEKFRNAHEALAEVRRRGYDIYAIEVTSGSKSLDELASCKKDISQIALVVGNEKTGVLPETLSLVDEMFHIPMKGVKESLNVGQAAAIAMWELVRGS